MSNEPRNKKSDKLEVTKRVRIVMDWIIEDYVYQDIVSKIMAKWKVVERQAKRYVSAALKEWAKGKDEDLAARRIRRIRALEKLARDVPAAVRKRPAGVMAIAKVYGQISKLEGSEAPRTIVLTGPNGKPIQTQRVEDAIDYDSLSTEVLEAIVAARKTHHDNDEEDTED